MWTTIESSDEHPYVARLTNPFLIVRGLSFGLALALLFSRHYVLAAVAAVMVVVALQLEGRRGRAIAQSSALAYLDDEDSAVGGKGRFERIRVWADLVGGRQMATSSITPRSAPRGRRSRPQPATEPPQ